MGKEKEDGVVTVFISVLKLYFSVPSNMSSSLVKCRETFYLKRCYQDLQELVVNAGDSEAIKKVL